MLKLNLSRLTCDEIADVISSHCTRFGLVRSVAIQESSTQHTFALVTMASAEESEAVANMFGDGWMDDKVIVRLQQEEPYIPSFLLRRRRSQIDLS